MALPAYGVMIYLLNHKQTAVSLLSIKASAARETLVMDVLTLLSALLFMTVFAELHFRQRNLLMREHWPKLGEWATRYFFVLLCLGVGLFRCRNECPAGYFIQLEEQVYKIRKYLLLAAATGATTSIGGSALLSIFSLPTEPPPLPPRRTAAPVDGATRAADVAPDGATRATDLAPDGAMSAGGGQSPSATSATGVSSGGAAPAGRAEAASPGPPTEEPFRYSNLLGILALSLAETLGWREALDAKPYGQAIASVLAVNMLLMPLLLVYVIWPMWVPQLPARLFMARLPGQLLRPLFSDL